MSQICQYFLKGSCKYGNKCHNLHHQTGRGGHRGGHGASHHSGSHHGGGRGGGGGGGGGSSFGGSGGGGGFSRPFGGGGGGGGFGSGAGGGGGGVTWGGGGGGGGGGWGGDTWGGGGGGWGGSGGGGSWGDGGGGRRGGRGGRGGGGAMDTDRPGVSFVASTPFSRPFGGGDVGMMTDDAPSSSASAFGSPFAATVGSAFASRPGLLYQGTSPPGSPFRTAFVTTSEPPAIGDLSPMASASAGFPSLYPHSLSSSAPSPILGPTPSISELSVASAGPLASTGPALPGLTEEETNAFRAGSFTFGKIPELEPPAGVPR